METEANKITKQPSYRFAGYTEAWEQRKLGDILQTLSFKQFLKEPEQDGRYEIIQQGNEPIIGYANGAPCNDYENTVIFGDHTLSLYKPKSPFFVATDGVRIVKGKNNFNGFYLMAMLEKYKPQNEGYKRYYSILADQECYLTDNTNEQRIIGQYFAQLDNLITLQQRKLEMLKEQKKTYLKLLFPAKGQTKPALRFAGFEDEWEQQKASEIFYSVSDKNHVDLPVLSASQEHGMVKRDEIGIDIKYDKASVKTYKRVKPGQFVIHLRSFQGGFAYSDIEGITSPAYTVIDFSKSNKHFDLFWKEVFTSQNFIKRLETVTYGIRDGRSISFSDFSSLKLQCPSLPEQEAIGSFFQDLDKAIAKQEEKVNQLKESKQTLLRKMFI